MATSTKVSPSRPLGRAIIRRLPPSGSSFSHKELAQLAWQSRFPRLVFHATSYGGDDVLPNTASATALAVFAEVDRHQALSDLVERYVRQFNLYCQDKGRAVAVTHVATRGWRMWTIKNDVDWTNADDRQLTVIKALAPLFAWALEQSLEFDLWFRFASRENPPDFNSLLHYYITGRVEWYRKLRESHSTLDVRQMLVVTCEFFAVLRSQARRGQAAPGAP